MAVLINGNGNEAIYAQQDADWYAALMGGQTMITGVGEQFAYELLDANTIGVKDGVIITKEGRRIQVDTNMIDTFDIPTGAQGTTNYYIIGYHLVTDETSTQTAETFVQLMENGTDIIPEGSFKEGDDDVYVSLYRVKQNDLTLGTITLLLPTVSDSMQQQISQISADLSVRNVLYDTTNNKLFQINPDGTKGSEIKMGLPLLDFDNPIFNFTSQNLSFTTTKDCWLFGSFSSGTSGSCTLKINNTAYMIATTGISGYDAGQSIYVSPLKLKANTTVSFSSVGSATKMYILDEL